VDVGSKNNATHHKLPRLIWVLDFEASYLTLKEKLPWVSCASLNRRDGGGTTDCKRVEICMSRYPCELVRLEQFRGYAVLYSVRVIIQSHTS
jgi:hypothetical protein